MEQKQKKHAFHTVSNENLLKTLNSSQQAGHLTHYKGQQRPDLSDLEFALYRGGCAVRQVSDVRFEKCP